MAHSGAGHIIASDIPNHFRFIDTLFKSFEFQLMTLSFEETWEIKGLHKEFSFCLSNQQNMKAYERVDVEIQAF